MTSAEAAPETTPDAVPVVTTAAELTRLLAQSPPRLQLTGALAADVGLILDHQTRRDPPLLVAAKVALAVVTISGALAHVLHLADYLGVGIIRAAIISAVMVALLELALIVIRDSRAGRLAKRVTQPLETYPRDRLLDYRSEGPNTGDTLVIIRRP